jgi:hypothetical protein
MIVVRGKGDIHDWQVKCVDQACNNGWMRDLENKAKPILTPLIQGQPALLSQNDQRVVAGWAVLKAIVGEYETGMISWSETDRGRMLRIQLPPAKDCDIWAAAIDPLEWKSQQWLCFGFPPFLRKAVAPDFNSAATTQIIGKLFLHVLHGPLLRLIKRTGRVPGNHARAPRIWPMTRKPVAWTGDPISEREGYQIASGLYSAIKAGARRAR